jgi:hypothetical protein
VLLGQRKSDEAGIGRLTLYVDVLTQAPLYLITRRPNDFVKEVGIFVGRFSGDDVLAPAWAGGGQDFGTVLPVAQSFFVAGEGGWIRESFDLLSDLPSEDQRRNFTSPVRLQRGR